jgi:hypothetical protein
MPDPIVPEPIPAGSISYTFNTSGVAPASGVSGVYAGPWAIETQELNIEYFRVPMVTGWPLNTTLALSGTRVLTDNVNTTKLQYRVTASYKMEKSYDSFSTSAFSQPQTFEWNGDPLDLDGQTYGALTTSANLGPAGTINTVQPYYRRVPWSDSLHTETTQAVTCANAGFYKGANVNENNGVTIQAEPRSFDDRITLDVSPAKNRPMAYQLANDEGVKWTGPGYVIGGDYAPSKESRNSIRNFINAVGDTLSASGFFAMLPTMNTVNSIATKPVADTGISNYDKSRHVF